MKTAMLLQRLENQLASLRQQCAPLARHETLSARFDRHLFRTRSTQLQAYLEEADGNLAALRQAVEQQTLPQIAWLAERLVAQIEAITRETATWSLRQWDSASPILARWHRKRLQHQEFERRLQQMLDERKVRLAQATLLADQQALQREVEAFAGRLARCREALEKIERVLARLTR
ncbi:TPA: primosomal replication protein N'' [Citrobacter freundii]